MAKRDPTVPRPPAGSPRYRRWRVYYEPGAMHNGSVAIETAWYAVSPGGDIIRSGDWNGIHMGIEEIEGARGRILPDDPPPPLIEGRRTAPWRFWEGDDRAT